MMRRRALTIAAVVLGLLTLGAIAWASIPGPDGVIHGCYKTSNPAKGSVIVIDHTASCPSGFAPLNWNQTGPIGPAGPTGPQGPVGTVAWSLVQGNADAVLTDAGYYAADVSLSCPSGKFTVSGGYRYDNAGFSNPAGVNPVENGYHGFSLLVGGVAFPTSWTTRVEAQSDGTLYVDIFCADPPS
jgi:hypothetical protein